MRGVFEAGRTVNREVFGPVVGALAEADRGEGECYFLLHILDFTP